MNFLNLSNYGETTTDDYWSKKRSAETEKEIVVLSNKATRLLEESVKSTKISLRGLDICWENTIKEIQGFFIYGAVGMPGIIDVNLIA
jgi:hypothetical protein